MKVVRMLISCAMLGNLLPGSLCPPGATGLTGDKSENEQGGRSGGLVDASGVANRSGEHRESGVLESSSRIVIGMLGEVRVLGEL